MGYSKYNEDNNEIIQDRLFMNDGSNALTIKTNVRITITTGPASEHKTRNVVEKNNPIVLSWTCKCCGKEFDIRRKTAHWYCERGLHLPKHCPDCIAARRKERMQAKEKENE